VAYPCGLTIASFAVLTDLKLPLVISILPYVFNSAFILLTIFFVRKKANVSFDGKLMSDHRRSLVTLITYHRPLTERQVVAIISLIVAVFTVLAVLSVVV